MDIVCTEGSHLDRRYGISNFFWKVPIGKL